MVIMFLLVDELAVVGFLRFIVVVVVVVAVVVVVDAALDSAIVC